MFPNFSARVDNFIQNKICCFLKKKAKKGGELDGIVVDSEYNKSAQGVNESHRESSMISG